jgi:transcriptional regulator with XRE-family HTH domain
MGVSQKAIADRLGINVSQISRKETGSEYFPRLPNLVAHLDILGARLAIELPDGTIILLPRS